MGEIWKKEGIAIGKAEMVLKALRTKFKTVPPWIEEAIRGMSDPIALELLLEQVFYSETMDEFDSVHNPASINLQHAIGVFKTRAVSIDFMLRFLAAFPLAPFSAVQIDKDFE